MSSLYGVSFFMCVLRSAPTGYRVPACATPIQPTDWGKVRRSSARVLKPPPDEATSGRLLYQLFREASQNRTSFELQRRGVQVAWSNGEQKEYPYTAPCFGQFELLRCARPTPLPWWTAVRIAIRSSRRSELEPDRAIAPSVCNGSGPSTCLHPRIPSTSKRITSGLPRALGKSWRPCRLYNGLNFMWS